MKKFLPYILAGGLGLVVAVVALGSWGGDEKAESADASATEAGEKKTVQVAQGGGEAAVDDAAADLARRQNPPEPGTLRPMNEAEIALQSRLERPFNQHLALVYSYWSQAGKLVARVDPELGKECGQMGRFLRDQGNLPDNEIDVAGAIAKEKALVAKLRAAGLDVAELPKMLDYIDASSQSVLDGGDPRSVPK